MQDAAGRLLGQALTSGARHLAFGMARVRFTQQVARYAKRIADEVAAGHLNPEQGILALAQEQRDLLNQSRILSRNPRPARARSLSAQPAAHSDPERLLRAVHRQNLNVSRLAAMSGPSPHPVNDLRFFPSELWPQEVPAPVEPGFYIVPKSLPAEALQARLFPSPKPNVIATFKRLNPLEDVVKAGSLIVLSDPGNQQCTYEESLLMETARTVSTALAPLTVEEADFMAQHYGIIQGALSDQSKVIGVVTAIAANHLDGIKSILNDIELLHTNTLEANGSLNSKDFKKQRAQLLKGFDGQLTRLTRETLNLPDYPNLKTALGIDNPHLIHRWRKAGGISQIPGYATHFQAVTNASQYVKYGGWIGTAVGGSASVMKVQEVCANGSIEACEKVKFTETGSFLGGVGGGIAAGALVSLSASTICVGVGLPTGGLGTVLCAALLAGVGNYAGGTLGEKDGDRIAEKVYEAVK
ncbi:hypothetical protein [Pseudomonas sp. B11(2017)]|uniref:hypothetical protein n=1 Tax=Pseudomonas sp. B11(2017) TaxID=1981748 RepID=UPI002113BDC4|nr:hypothetical protein [Pseudomonas sp. B11(2017)]